MNKIFTAGAIAAAGLAIVSSAQAAGGCGWGAHRGPYGGCRANVGRPVVVAPARPVVIAPARPVVVTPGGAVVVAPAERPCPVGYHLGPAGRRCWPN